MDVSGYTDDELVSKVPLNAQAFFQTPYTLEMQRRLLIAIRDFNAASQKQATAADKQADKMIALTRWIIWLTVVIAALTAVLVWKELAHA